MQGSTYYTNKGSKQPLVTSKQPPYCVDSESEMITATGGPASSKASGRVGIDSAEEGKEACLELMQNHECIWPQSLV